MLRVFAYLLTAQVLLDFQAYWRTWDSAPYVEVDATYLRGTALGALIAGAFVAFAHWRELQRERQQFLREQEERKAAEERQAEDERVLRKVFPMAFRQDPRYPDWLVRERSMNAMREQLRKIEIRRERNKSNENEAD